MPGFLVRREAPKAGRPRSGPKAGRPRSGAKATKIDVFRMICNRTKGRKRSSVRTRRRRRQAPMCVF